jgi:dipeptidyl aminopeptidase/acylaminoacyl peptidase
VQVWSHGGPTAFSDAAFSLTTQFWTTRGIGILDVNYSGSSGYGRPYRERLHGGWGIVDVRDCVDGVRALVDAGLADPARLSIRGSSAGGYTTLAALTTSTVFAAGISLYGIADLEALVTETHKFESGYNDWLIAPWPAGRQTYRERSPIHHLDRLSCPMLILQGRLDRVVPPNQAEAMAAAVRAKGLPVDVVWFDDEGHGFRRAESIIATAEAALAFLGRVHGFTPAT